MESPPLVICNTTPVINFAETGRLDVLAELFGEVVLPRAVVQELTAKRHRFPAAAAAWRSAPFRVREVPEGSADRYLGATLHPGECACLALAAAAPNSLLILDDVAARDAAVVSGYAVTGTLGCLLEAKKAGIIAAVAPLLDALAVRARFWTSKPLRAAVLRKAGE